MEILTRGNGPDLLLLPGWGMNRRVWEVVAGALSERFRVHCAAQLEWDIARAALTLLDALPHPIVPVGWSAGGAVAVRMAALRPQAVPGVALVASSPAFTARPGWPQGMALPVFDAFAAGVRADPVAALDRFCALMARGAENARALSRQLQQTLAAGGPPDAAWLAQGLNWLRAADWRADAAALRQPALLVYSDNDPLVPPGCADWLAAALPAARQVRWADGAHVPFLARPEEFVRLIGDFADGLVGGQGE